MMRHALLKCKQYVHATFMQEHTENYDARWFTFHSLRVLLQLNHMY